VVQATTKPEPKCPTCQGPMERGFVVDFTYPANRALVANWVEGLPTKNSGWARAFTTGIWGGVDLDGREQREIAAFRCPRCGLLQNYAL
jgi:hypothetical protein